MEGQDMSYYWSDIIDEEAAAQCAEQNRLAVAGNMGLFFSADDAICLAAAGERR